MSKISILIVALLAVFASSTGCGSSGNSRQLVAPAPLADKYEAQIRWTSYGVPHILAKDLASATFGQGYAFTVQYPCVLARQIIRVRGEYAKYFGPGKADIDVSKDLGYKALGLMKQAGLAVNAMSTDARRVMEGFVAGYNHRLTTEDAAKVPAECRGAKWRRPITVTELVAYGMHISMIGSLAPSVHMIGQAQPPKPTSSKDARKLPGFEFPPTEALASNAWAIGAERSENGRGLLVANPHFPWRGPLRFYESHLTVPGKLNAYGANLLGLPLVSIAFNEHLGWSHTFSASRRFAIYRLALDKDDPTKYRYGKETRAMTSKQVSIEVKQADGTLKSVNRTVYNSHYGPVVSGGFLPWSKKHAYAIRDAASPNNRSIDQYLGMLRAHDLTGFKAAMRKYHSTPFVNTIYADKHGNAFYVDGSRVPRLSGMATNLWKMARSNMAAVRIAWERGVIALDGSMKLFEWRAHKDAPAPGVVPFDDAPQLTRRDFVFNANDSFWIANPAQPLKNPSPFYGETNKTLTARTRMNLKLLTERGDKGASGSDGKFTAKEIEAAALSNRAWMAESFRDQVVERCRIAGKKESTLGPLCVTLANWDLRLDLDSVGAVLWREFAGTFTRADYYSGKMFVSKFDAKQPMVTPHTFVAAPNKGSDPIVDKLRAAAASLRKLGIDPTKATLRQLQYTQKGNQRIPVHGGSNAEGATNVVFYRKSLPGADGKLINKSTGLFKNGYPINYGTSFMMVLGFTDKGPKARAIMTYSGSGNSSSPNFKDQTELFAKKQLRDVRFTEAEIKADPNLRVETVSAARAK